MQPEDQVRTRYDLAAALPVRVAGAAALSFFVFGLVSVVSGGLLSLVRENSVLVVVVLGGASVALLLAVCRLALAQMAILSSVARFMDDRLRLRNILKSYDMPTEDVLAVSVVPAPKWWPRGWILQLERRGEDPCLVLASYVIWGDREHVERVASEIADLYQP